MNDTHEIPRGFTGCLTKAGLAIGSTPAELAVVAPNGAGVDFVINGICYHLADDASTSGIPAATTAQAALTQCLYLFQVNAGGTMLVTKGTEQLTTDINAGKTALYWPAPTAAYCPIAGYRVALVGAATYTSGTTDHNATNVTTTYYDFAGGMPTGPIIA